MTSKRWLRMFGIRTAKIVFALSLLISCLTFGAGDPNSQIAALRGRSPEEQLRLLNSWASDGDLDTDVATKVSEIDAKIKVGDDGQFHMRPIEAKWLQRQVEIVTSKLMLQAQLRSASVSDDSVALAKKIKSSPVYRDTGPKETPNWLSNAFDKLNNIHPKCNCNHPINVSPEAANGAKWVVYLIWGILVAALLGFIVFALRKVSWSRRLQRKAKALLDEDEPERTVDEWLEMADKLEREGRFREAVRCLYLACLLKIDEARIARFERSQTNWEHLARIEASHNRPATLDFREPTKAFDTIWYVMRVNGSEDVMRFRVWYREVTQAVRPKEAA